MRKIIALVAVALVTAVGCANSSPSNPAPDSDSEQAYVDGSAVPTDLNVYDITGTVTGAVSSLTRQQSPAQGELFGAGSASGFGISGSFFGPVQTGKGFVRITVKDVSPATDLAPVGALVVLKMTDTKGTALLPGDTVHFRCRRQYEAVAAVEDNQKFDAGKDATWELDFCRLATPVIAPSARASAK